MDDAQSEELERDEAQAQGNFQIAELQVQGHPEFPFSGLLVAEHQHRQALHGEAPHHAESVSLAQHKNISSAQDDRKELQGDDEVEDTIGSSETEMRITKPVGMNSV